MTGYNGTGPLLSLQSDAAAPMKTRNVYSSLCAQMRRRLPAKTVGRWPNLLERWGQWSDAGVWGCLCYELPALQSFLKVAKEFG